MSSWVLRLWLPDRPGALGAVASRIGAVRGDVVGIDILERGAGRAVDDLVVELPDDDLVGLLAHEVGQVDGVDVEEIRPAASSLHDPRLDALETAAALVSAPSVDDLLGALCAHGARTLGAAWAVVVGAGPGEVLASWGSPPPARWLAAFVSGSRSSPAAAASHSGPDDVLWAPLAHSGLSLVAGREAAGFRARERRQAAVLARIVDARHRELAGASSRSVHPASRHR